MQPPPNLPNLPNLRTLKSPPNRPALTASQIDTLLSHLQSPSLKSRSEFLPISVPDFISLCRQSRSLLLQQPSLLSLNGPITVSTGTGGNFRELLNIFSRCGHPGIGSYLFLGDYVGNGGKNIQCLVYMMGMKIRYKNNFFMIRGCADGIGMGRANGFYAECLERVGSQGWAEACEMLDSLPFAAIVEHQIFCVHGGISPVLRSVQEINRITRPLETPQVGLPCDLIWSDPSYKEDSLAWIPSERGFGYSYSQKAVGQFLKENKLSVICRAHEPVYDGFYINRQKTIATICSIANYGGLFNNSAAVLILNAQYQMYFKVIKQRDNFPTETYFKDSANSLLKKVIEQKRLIKRKKQQQQKSKQQSEQKSQSSINKKQGSKNSIKSILDQEEIRQKQGEDEGAEEEEGDEEYRIKMKVLKGQAEIFYLADGKTRQGTEQRKAMRARRSSSSQQADEDGDQQKL